MGRFRLDFDRLFTCDMGQLIPCGFVEVLPGDTFHHRSQAFIRLSPMAAPVMHALNVRVEHYFIPARLTMPAGTPWEPFITGGEDGTDTSQLPKLTTSGTKNDLFDYFGLPVRAGIEVNSNVIRGFNHVWNEYFRDQDLAAERLKNDVTVPRVAWAKDRETTARPAPQKGTEVTLPLGTEAPVKGFGKWTGTYASTNQSVRETGGNDVTYTKSARVEGGGNDVAFNVQEDPDRAGYPGVFADLTNAAAATVNSLRRAFAIQYFQEKMSRSGSRYSEYLWHSFRVRSPDARLQRPEYLGGHSSEVAISEVLQTAPDGSTPRFGVADLYGHGLGHSRGGYRARFLEHGFVLSVFFVRPKPVYTEGVDRHWLRQDRFDFFHPALQHIGQEAMFKGEVYADGSATDLETFGWVDRFSDYTQVRSGVAGEFRDELDYWHLGRKFNAHQVLGEDFITCTPSKRIFNEQNRHSLWCTVRHFLGSKRPVAQTRIGRNI